MDIQNSLKKIEKWYGTMATMSILFAIVSFILWAGLNSIPSTGSYEHAVARFWTSLSLTIIFAVFSVTIRKIHKALVLITEKK